MKTSILGNIVFGIFGVIIVTLLSIVIFKLNGSNTKCMCDNISSNTIELDNNINTVCVGGCPVTVPINTQSDMTLYIGDNVTFNIGNNMQFVPIHSQLNTGVDYDIILYNQSTDTNTYKQIAARLLRIDNGFVFALNPSISYSKLFVFTGVNSYVSPTDTTNIIDIYTVMLKSVMYPFKGGCMHIRGTSKWTCQLSSGPIICGVHYDPSFVEANWNAKIITDNGVSSTLVKNAMVEIPVQLPSTNTVKVMFTLYSNTFGVVDSNMYKRMLYIQSSVSDGNLCISSKILFFLGTSQPYICFSYQTTCTSNNKVYYRLSPFNSNSIVVGLSDSNVNVGMATSLLLVECS